MRPRHTLPLLLLTLLIGLSGCEFFTGDPATALQVTLYVNGQLWTPPNPNDPLTIETRPDYSIKAVTLRFDVIGGDPRARYRVEYVDGVAGREEWFDASATIQVSTSQEITVRSGVAKPIVYDLVIVNHAPVLYSVWISDATPEMGAHLRVMVEYHDPNTCPSVAVEQITGAYDEDSEHGDTLTYRLRITGPKKGSWEDSVVYQRYEDLPGASTYVILSDEWLPIETQTHTWVGYDGVAPGVGVLSAASSRNVFADIVARGCYPDPDEPYNAEDPWPSGKNLRIEKWVMDSMGAVSYGKDYFEIYVGGCP